MMSDKQTLLDFIEDLQQELNQTRQEREALRITDNTTTFTAPRCVICHHPEEPELLNVTMFHDELPRWTIGWQCGNSYLHKRMKMNAKKDHKP
jgi:hypothetical protein